MTIIGYSGEFSDQTFVLYCLALGVSGLIMLAIAATGFGTPSVGARVLNALFGLGFIGYAGYLLFIFGGGEFRMLVYAFLVPVFALIQAIRGFATRRRAPAATE